MKPESVNTVTDVDGQSATPILNKPESFADKLFKGLDAIGEFIDIPDQEEIEKSGLSIGEVLGIIARHG